MSEHPRLALSELHLAAEAIVAYLDGELAPGPEQRATQHLEHCGECRGVLAIQRQAKSTLGRAWTPPPDQDLLQKLRNIPVETDLPGHGDMTLAMDGEQIVWRNKPPRTRSTRSSRRRSGPAGPDTARRDHTGPQRRTPHVLSISRGLLGAAAAVMVGMLAVTTPSSASGSGTHDSPAATRTGPAQLTPGDRSVESTNVVTASIPHMFGDEPPLLEPRSDRDDHSGVAFVSSGARP